MFHQTRAFFVEHGAVFNRVHARTHGGFNAVRAFGVGHDFFAGAVRNLDGFGHLLLTELLHTVIADRVEHSTCGHQFDPVRSILNVAPHHDSDFIRCVRDVWSPRQSDIGSEHVAVAMSAIERNAAAGRYHARAANQSQINTVAQGELSVEGIALASIAHCREAVIEPYLQIVHAPNRLLR